MFPLLQLEQQLHFPVLHFPVFWDVQQQPAKNAAMASVAKL